MIQTPTAPPELSPVLACYNEEPILVACVEELVRTLDGSGVTSGCDEERVPVRVIRGGRTGMPRMRYALGVRAPIVTFSAP